MDVAGASVMKNLDTSPDGRAWSKEMSGTFPIRIRGIYTFNAGFFMRARLSVAKWILPKKLMERLKIVDKKDLVELIPEQHLPDQFGGKYMLNHEEALRQLEPERELVHEARLKLAASAPTVSGGETTETKTKKKKKDKKA
jgi:hypothetical protein